MTITRRRSSSSTITTPVWLRWMPLWHGLFYTALLLPTAIALTLDKTSSGWQNTGAQLGLSLALALWYGICVVRSPLSWRGRPLLIMLYLVIGWALWFALAQFDPIYLFILTGLYPQLFLFAPLPGKVVGAFLLTALAAWRQITLVGGIEGNLFFTLIAAAAGVIMALFIYAVVEQSQQRQQLIGELETTRQALAATERQAGMMAERQRLAREIHDTLAQGFTSIVMHLEAAEAALPAELSMLQRHLNQARRTARESLEESRRVLWALQPATLDGVSLTKALEHVVARWTEESGVTAYATITGTPQALLPEIEVTLLRAAQEALANVRKHANANQVVLTLSYMHDTVVLDVQDDGIGFDPSCLCKAPTAQPVMGFGLKALRERSEHLGGTLSIESAPGEGTTIAVALPAVSSASPLSPAVVQEAH